jgi:hypothetical protein
MGSLNIGNATVIGGVRVEHTSSEFSAYDIQFGTATSRAIRSR